MEFSAPPDIARLNEQQKKAVLHEGGPLLVFAGAGSGKTRVITSRIARLLSEGVPPYRVLAVTFTNKAAREMKERLESHFQRKPDGLWVGTFHSICGRILRVEGHHIGVPNDYVIYDDSDQITLVKSILKLKGYSDKEVPPRKILDMIGRAKETLRTPEQFRAMAQTDFQMIAAEVYDDYEKRLQDAHALDFDDLLVKTVRLFQKESIVLNKYADRFLHIMVDEYQDINFVQYQMVSSLAAKHKNLTVVGDDDQSIYSWRGADVKIIQQFAADYPDAEVVLLEQNYRSTKTILEAANHVIRQNTGRADKKLWTENESGRLIELIEAGSEYDEASNIANRIQDAVNESDTRYDDIAILYRTNRQSRVLEEELIRRGIPYAIIGGTRFYDRKEIKDALAYLKLVLNPADEISFRRVVNVPARGIGETTMAKLAHLARAQGKTLFEAASEYDVRLELPKKAARALLEFIELFEKLREDPDPSVSKTLNLVLRQSGYLQMLAMEGTAESEDRIGNLEELESVARDFEQTADDPSLLTFLEQVALTADVDSLDESSSGQVKLLTLHSSKGLEFPLVFIAGMEEGIFPHSRSFDNRTELEEERRLCYVGMTRAMRQLVLAFSRSRSSAGPAMPSMPSRFLSDIPEEFVDRKPSSDFMVGYSSWSSRVRPEMFSGSSSVAHSESAERKRDLWNPPFNVGDRVSHSKFGTGVVIACAPLKQDAEVTVAFPGETGVKKLVQSFAKLVKEV